MVRPNLLVIIPGIFAIFVMSTLICVGLTFFMFPSDESVYNSSCDLGATCQDICSHFCRNSEHSETSCCDCNCKALHQQNSSIRIGAILVGTAFGTLALIGFLGVCFIVVRKYWVSNPESDPLMT